MAEKSHAPSLQSIQNSAPVDETADVFGGSKFTTTGEVCRIFVRKTSPVVLTQNPRAFSSYSLELTKDKKHTKLERLLAANCVIWPSNVTMKISEFLFTN